MSRHLSTPGKMCFSAEVSLITSGVLVLVGVCMMIRRLPLDVMLAGFVLMLGVIQMIEFGIHSKLLQSSEAGRLLYVTLLTQCAVLALGVWAMFGGATSGGLAVVTTGVLLAGVCVVVTSNFSAKPGSSGHIEWSKDHGPLLGGVMGGLYLFGLFAPLVLITVLADHLRDCGGMYPTWVWTVLCSVCVPHVPSQSILQHVVRSCDVFRYVGLGIGVTVLSTPLPPRSAEDHSAPRSQY
jgi:hypothetical protein